MTAGDWCYLILNNLVWLGVGAAGAVLVVRWL